MYYLLSEEVNRVAKSMEDVTNTLQYEPKRGENHKNPLLAFLHKRNLEAERKRKAASSAITNPDEAMAYAANKRRVFKEIMGELPGPTHVTPTSKITAVHTYNGYVVENILIESLPGYFLTANLYKPGAQDTPGPGILFLCGHTENGKAWDSYAAFCAEAALNGFNVLTFDPVGQGERFFMEGKDPDSVHCHIGHQMFALGQPLTTYMHYDNIRALDYLVSRPDVDAGRIAAVGQSGGGQTSAFMGAYDDRLAAVAPSCYITELTQLANGIGIQEIEQSPLGFLSAGLGLSDLIIAAAPRPYMVSGGLYDFFPVEGMRDAVLEARRVYSLLGADLQSYVSAKPHGMWYDNRRAIIEFLCNHLLGSKPKVVCEKQVEIPCEEDLYCAGGDVRTINTITLIEIARQRAAAKATPLTGEAALEDAVKRLGLNLDKPEKTITIGNEYFIKPEKDIQVCVTPRNEAEKPQAVTVFVGPGAKLDGDFYQETVLCVEPRGTGHSALPLGCFYTDTDDRYMNRESAVNWNAILHGRSILGMRALDIAHSVDFAKKYVKDKPVILQADGAMALPALFSAIKCPPDVLKLSNLLPSFKEITHSEDYTATISDMAFGLGVDYDIPDIIEALRARGVKIEIM